MRGGGVGKGYKGGEGGGERSDGDSLGGRRSSRMARTTSAT